MGEKDQCNLHESEFTAAGMWSLRVRRIYIAEFIIFAIPATIILGYFAVLAGVESGRFFFSSALSALSQGGVENTPRIVGSLMGLSIASLSISALWTFLRLSLYYVRGKRTAPVQARRRYRWGVIYAVIPLIIVFYGIFASIVAEQLRFFLPILSVSLIIFVPAAHLGFALRAGNVSRNS